MSAGPSPAKDGSQVARKVKPPPGGVRFAKIHDGKQLMARVKKLATPEALCSQPPCASPLRVFLWASSARGHISSGVTVEGGGASRLLFRERPNPALPKISSLLMFPYNFPATDPFGDALELAYKRRRKSGRGKEVTALCPTAGKAGGAVVVRELRCTAAVVDTYTF